MPRVLPHTLKVVRPAAQAADALAGRDPRQRGAPRAAPGALITGLMDKQSQPIRKARTILAQALGAGDATTRALVPPVHMSATFLRDADNGYESGYVYGRTDNATVKQVEAILTHLEGGHDALRVQLRHGRGDRGVPRARSTDAHRRVRGHLLGLSRVARRHRRATGTTVTFVDTSDLDAVAAAMRPGETGLIWIETPSNPLWTLTDIAAIAEIAHAAGALVCVDSTVSTPMLTRPIEFGADIVVHSATKYLNGHSDVIAGAVVVAADSALWQGIQKIRSHIGSILGPFEAWLLMRGMRTLDVRVREQSRSAARLAELLSEHDAVAAVLYPGLPTHPGHDIAVKQMHGGFGGMLSVRMKGGERAAVAAAAKVEVWRRATSLGGVESLIEHRASIEGVGTPCPHDLLRLSTGLEDPHDLFLDLVKRVDDVTADARATPSRSRSSARHPRPVARRRGCRRRSRPTNAPRCRPASSRTSRARSTGSPTTATRPATRSTRRSGPRRRCGGCCRRASRSIRRSTATSASGCCTACATCCARTPARS